MHRSTNAPTATTATGTKRRTSAGGSDDWGGDPDLGDGGYEPITAGANLDPAHVDILRAILVCMGKKHNLWDIVKRGMTDRQLIDLEECKEEAMRDRGLPVYIDLYDFTNGGDSKNLCDDIDDALTPTPPLRRGAAVAVIGRWIVPEETPVPPFFQGHQVEIVSVECYPTHWEITVRDPNFPTGPTYTITVDCFNLVSDTGGHPDIRLNDNLRIVGLERTGDRPPG